MASTFGIVYATNSKMLRRIILVDDDKALTDGTHLVGPGETLHIQPGQLIDEDHAKAIIHIATGVAPPSSRCAVVDSANKVVHLIHADPEIDQHPLGQLVSCHDGVMRGHVYDHTSKTFSGS